jgi:tetratricopeptide (TPR) repeat protein
MSRNNLAHLFLTQNRLLDCIQTLEPTISAEPENRLALLNLGTAYLLHKSFDQAKSCFEKYTELVTDDAAALAKLAWAEFELNKDLEANLHLGQAKKIAPNHPTVQYIEKQFGPQ